MNNQDKLMLIAIVAMSLAVVVDNVSGAITVQIGGVNRLGSSSRTRDRYSCFWDCDLVGCKIARDDDECAYDCEKVCKVRFDTVTMKRTNQLSISSELNPKSGATIEEAKDAELPVDGLLRDGTSIRLHLPRNATARSFAIMDGCDQLN